MTLYGDSADLSGSDKNDWRSILQLIMSLLASLCLFGLAALFFIFSALRETNQFSFVIDPSVFVTLGFIFLALALLILPSGISAFYRIKDRKWLVGSTHRARVISLFYLPALLAVLALGLLLEKLGSKFSYLLSLLGVLAICLPVLCLVHFGALGLNGGSPQRKWGLLALGLTITPAVILVVELFALLLAGAGVTLWVSSKPDILDLITRLGMQLTMAEGDPDALFATIKPYLTQPLTIFSILAATSVIVPLIEEVFKTIGIWLFAKRSLTPAQGYVAGLYSGAGLALVEGLFTIASINSGQSWLILVVGRIGSSLMHIFTGGLIGWGLASSWQQAKPIKYLTSFLASLLIHGLWNALAVAGGLLPFILTTGASPTYVQTALYTLPIWVLGLLIMAAYVSFTLMVRNESSLQEVVV